MTSSRAPRQHSMKMKYALAGMALQMPDRFFPTFGPGGESDYLEKLWAAIGEDFPPAERAPAKGARTWHRAAGAGPEILVLILPPTVARNEPYFLAVVRDAEGAVRVFCLERSVAVDPQPKPGFFNALKRLFRLERPVGVETSVLVEFSLAGRSSWGAGPAAEVEAFVDAVSRIHADPAARPFTFIPMRFTS